MASFSSNPFIPHHASHHPLIFLGGSMNSAPQRSYVPSQAQPSSQTGAPSWTPAQVLVSALLLATSGERGISSWGGRQTVETSGGQRLSASSSSLDLSVQQAYQASFFFSKALVTTAVSLRAGGKEEAETGKPTKSSGASTTSRILTNAPVSHATLPAARIQLMAPPEDSTLQSLVSSQRSASQTLSRNLSSTSITNPSLADVILDLAGLSLTPSPIIVSPTNRVRHSTNANCLIQPQPIIHATRPRPSKPSAYQPSLFPLPSPLHTLPGPGPTWVVNTLALSGQSALYSPGRRAQSCI